MGEEGSVFSRDSHRTGCPIPSGQPCTPVHISKTKEDSVSCVCVVYAFLLPPLLWHSLNLGGWEQFAVAIPSMTVYSGSLIHGT